MDQWAMDAGRNGRSRAPSRRAARHGRWLGPISALGTKCSPAPPLQRWRHARTPEENRRAAAPALFMVEVRDENGNSFLFLMNGISINPERKARHPQGANAELTLANASRRGRGISDGIAHHPVLTSSDKWNAVGTGRHAPRLGSPATTAGSGQFGRRLGEPLPPTPGRCSEFEGASS